MAYQLNTQLETISYTALPDADRESLDQTLLALGLVQMNEMVQTSSSHQTLRNRCMPGSPRRLPFGIANDWDVVWISLAFTGDSRVGPSYPDTVLARPSILQGSDRSARRYEANMDTLVALGTTVAYAFSLYQWPILGDEAVGNLYFEASALVITLVLFGKSIENRAKQTALESLSLLLELEPKTATCLRAGRGSVSQSAN